MNSRTGYSGSPVFIYRTPGFDLEKNLDEARRNKKVLLDGANYLALLGIHFSQFPEYWELKRIKKDAAEASQKGLIIEGDYVRGLSGMTCVLPAWSIMDVLNLPKLREHRRMQDDMEERGMFRDRLRPEPESASPTGPPGTRTTGIG